MLFDFIRRMSLRRQIVWGTSLFTAVISLLVGAVLFALSDAYIRVNTLRSVEFNLQQMTASVQNSLDTAQGLLNWASTDSTLRLYLTVGQPDGQLTTSAYDIFSDRYLSSQLQTRIVRFFVTDGRSRFLIHFYICKRLLISLQHCQVLTECVHFFVGFGAEVSIEKF